MSTTTRDINTLLGLATYQGMTDEEIELIIDYKITSALSSAEMTAKINAITAREQQIVADNAANAAALLTMVQSMQQQLAPIAGVGSPQIVTPSGAEVSNG